MLKKLIAVFTLITLVCSMSYSAMAAPAPVEVAVEDVSLRVPTACPGGNGIHQMRRRGTGDVFSTAGENLIYGPCWQCTNCYTVMITSDDPTGYNGIVGDYASAAADGPISIYGTQIYVKDSNSIDYEGSSTLAGHRFYNQPGRALDFLQ